jgi:hypothetical protein
MIGKPCASGDGYAPCQMMHGECIQCGATAIDCHELAERLCVQAEKLGMCHPSQDMIADCLRDALFGTRFENHELRYKLTQVEGYLKTAQSALVLSQEGYAKETALREEFEARERHQYSLTELARTECEKLNEKMDWYDSEFKKAKNWNELCELQMKNLRSIVEDQDKDIAKLKGQMSQELPPIPENIRAEIMKIPPAPHHALLSRESEISIPPICWVCDGEMEARGGKLICVPCDKAFRDSQTQLRLCEEHAGSMSKDFDASISVVQRERDLLKGRVYRLERECIETRALCEITPDEDDLIREVSKLRAAAEDVAKLRDVLRELQAACATDACACHDEPEGDSCDYCLRRSAAHQEALSLLGA